jgi:outer membrane protein assembly factor BamB
MTGTDLYLGTDYSGQVVVIDKGNGEARVLVNEENYALAPLGVRGDVVMVSAKRTRGTTKYEIWGIDKETGKRLWSYSLGESEALEDHPGLIAEGDSIWMTHLTEAGLVVLWVRSAPHQVVLETLNPADGVSGGPKTLGLDFDTPFLGSVELLGWTQDTAWLMLENTVLGVDTRAGTIAYRWP